MLAKVFDLVRFYSTTPGTGSLAIGSAVPGFLTPALAGVANGDLVSYGIRDGSNSEVGVGTYSTTGPTLARTTILKSTNGNAAINLSGSEEVGVVLLAEHTTMSGALTTTYIPQAEDATHLIDSHARDNGSAIVVDYGSGTLPTFTAGTAIALAQPDNTNTRYAAYSWGTGAPAFIAVRAKGSRASPTGLVNNDVMFAASSFGHDGSAYTTTVRAQFRFMAAGTWVSGDTPTKWDILLTPVGAAVSASVLGQENDGGLMVPTAVTGGSKGSGTINVSGGYYINGVNLKGNLPATATNDNATAGTVGEYVSSTVNSGSGPSQARGNTVNVTSISLTAGDWDVEGFVGFVLVSGSTTTYVSGGVSSSSVSLPPPADGSAYFGLDIAIAASGTTKIWPTGSCRISLASTTTVYLVARSTYTGGIGNATVWGHILARRVR